MKLVEIPKDKFNDYRLNALFDCYKWDPQFEDNNTLSKFVLVLTEDEYLLIKDLTEKLDEETRKAEVVINNNFKLAKKLDLPKKLYKDLKKMNNYDESNNIRLMRYDFHPTDEGFAVSEVNSDVPGGFAEASLLPKLAIKTLKSKDYYSIDFGDILSSAIASKVKKGGKIMFVHCTCYSDDRQVMQYIGDKMESIGYKSIYGAADHLIFKDKRAYSILNGYEGEVDCIFRFTPLEWLKDIKPRTWDGYFDTLTLSCNHPVAIYAQTKRFPLIWKDLEKIGVDLSTWKELLPDTHSVSLFHKRKGYIYKPACGRVGEDISIREACGEGEYKEIIKKVYRKPWKFIEQKKFISKPLVGPDGINYHLCLGSYSVMGSHAGFYARISEKTRIDSDACDIPVVIERGVHNDK